MRILGVDPGSLVTGFGVVERIERRVTHVAHGTVRSPAKTELATRLALIHQRLLSVVEEHRPDVAVVERVFVASNPQSALVLGQARGVALAALAASGVQVSELSAREVKKAVTGSGAAGKDQVTQMVRRLLVLETLPPTDAADALALALCHAQGGRLSDMGVRTPSRRKRRSQWAALVEERTR